MEFKEFTGKTVEEAVTAALVEFQVTGDRLEYEVIEKETKGLFGLGQKDAVIRARKAVEDVEDIARKFLEDVLDAMNVQADLDVFVDEEDKSIEIEIEGDDMGLLIGKRGQTLDSLQYLCSLAVNKKTDDYYRVRLDTENYRYRREVTLKKLAKSIAAKVRRTRRSVSLEPMSPYERRIIHSTLQDDLYVTTRSDGEEPYRHVIVCLKK
ncbi:MAG: protein jag [Lachnospiraceae bacterium]|nr:protein jag [Lachnospiraceae bacterium]MBQ1515379.1 protein jag [Lachnospiraceae bacterium]MBQ3400260.1 protein jag [Lachnospiraceae bacterium]MBQ4308699.1 protein jag [Lachnospiraceae bacterium]MBQ9464829.1 protein jag [Lachnospiraceae bacterium]